MFLEILQGLQFYKREALAHVFSCEYCEIFKNSFFTEHLWTTASVIRTVECGILAIKKTSVKTLQIGLYSLIFMKRAFFYLNFSSIATLKKKDDDFLCQLCFLSLYLFWLTACILDFFYSRILVTIMN